MRYNLNFLKFNERSVLINWPQRIDENILNDILSFKNQIKNNSSKLIIEITHTYNSICVTYESTIDNFNSRFNELKLQYKHQNEEIIRVQREWNIPVSYDLEFGSDLQTISKLNGLSLKELIQLHSEPLYKVYFLGFLPGFPYLGGLNPRLFIKRKRKPSLKISKGSVAIGGEQTGIYSQQSPGGWYVVGRTPIDFFDPLKSVPCFLEPGDNIRFVPISSKKFRSIKSSIQSNEFSLKPIYTNVKDS